MGKSAITLILPSIPLISSFVSGSTPEKLLSVNDAPIGERGLAICLVRWLVCRCIDTAIGSVTQVRHLCFVELLLAADGTLYELELRHG